ncbi:hypothetical protein H3302_08025 [Pseudoalteromonas sp. MT33b]|uniref:hypothetical protein n=1 Tax=Pseudoalteromonas sp. MT33b TaxID=2759705 RepID=UPI0015F7B83D|nr:hypothetical protein [Pseudoalteromonas sp. MT33b]QMW15992.1 hypothetical protein H3302_08025 [Pseudoalteromonas sp. MT33b]
MPYKFINKIEFLQRSVRYNESNVDALRAKIAHVYDLVEVSETLKIIGFCHFFITNNL